MSSAVLGFSTPVQILSFAATDDFHKKQFRSDEASYVMEILQTELDRIGTQKYAQRRNYLKSIRHLNRVHGVLPPSMFLTGLTRESATAVAGGGFADVWIGSLNQQRVCIKVLRFFQQGSDREELLKALSKEVLLWRQLKHPNILPFLGVNTELFAPSFCIVSPWMSNGDIMAYARNIPLDLGAKLQHTIQITEGLLYLHGLDPPVVHGDIKGANILISDDHCCCLADFGLSVLDTQSIDPTVTATVQGSLRWLAPEFINPTPMPINGKLTSRDIYAFGCTMFEILTGQPPFSHLNIDVSVAIEVLKGVRPILSSAVVPKEAVFKLICALLDSCWEEEIMHRPDAQTICDFLKHVYNVLHLPEAKMNILTPLLEELEIMRYTSLDLDVKGQARANQYTPRPQDLQQLYDQALAAFEAEGSKSPTPVIVKSLSPSHVSSQLSTFHLNLPNPAVTPPKTGSGRENRERESTDSDDISRIYSIYASSSNNEHRSSASNHNRNNDLCADDYDNQSIHAMFPVSAAASHAKNRPSSPIVSDENLRHLYDQVLAGFQTEGSQSPTATTLECASASPPLITAPLPPSPRTAPGLHPSPSPKSGIEMNRYNSTASTFSTTIHNGVDAQGGPVVPPPPLLPSQPSYSMPEPDPYYGDADFGGPSAIVRRPTDILKDLRDSMQTSSPSYDHGAGHDYQQVADKYSFTSSRRRRNQRTHRGWTWEYSSDNPDEHNYSSEQFVNFSLLSHLAVQLRDKVPREVHTKASIPYERAFTGKDIVDTIQALIKKHLFNLTAFSSSYPPAVIMIDRKAALHVARSLQTQLLFSEVEGGGRELSDGVEDVYMFSNDSTHSATTDSGDSALTTAELPLPTAVVTMLTRCYVPTCVDDKPCYAWDCPKRGQSLHRMLASFSLPSSRLNNINFSSSSKPKMKPNASTTPKSAVGLAKSTSIASSYPNTSNNSGSRFSVSSDRSGQSSKRTLSGPTTEDENKPWKETVSMEVLSRIPEGEVRKPKETAISSEDEGDWYIRNDPSETGYDDGYDEDSDGFDGDWGLNECAFSTDSESDVDQEALPRGEGEIVEEDVDEDDGVIQMRARRDSFIIKSHAKYRWSTSEASSSFSSSRDYSSSTSAPSSSYSSSLNSKPLPHNIRRRKRSDDYISRKDSAFTLELPSQTSNLLEKEGVYSNSKTAGGGLSWTDPYLWQVWKDYRRRHSGAH